MRKLLLFLLVIPVISFSQVKLRSEILMAKKTDAENFQNKEVWLDWDISYIMKFEQNPVGIKHLIEKVKIVLKDNELNFDKPYIENFQNLNTSILAGDSEIKKTWIPTTGRNYIVIRLNKEKYELSISK